MKRVGGHGSRGDAPGQLQIEWSGVSKPAAVRGTSPLPAPHSAPPVLRLKWDFATTFPQPTSEALEAGVISDDDAEPQNVRALHGEHARELLAVLHDIDALADARRRGVDPATGNAPRTEATRTRLAKLFESEPGRLERWWQTQLDVYEEVFGSEAADAFAKAVRAWHACIDVSTETEAKPTPHAAEVKPDLFPSSRSRREGPKRIPARLPVPRPLPSAIAAARFGQEENGKPVRPGAHEVRAITEQHAEKLIDMLDSIPSTPADARPQLLESFQSAIAAYAEDFGQPAAAQLEAYVRRQAALNPCRQSGR